MEVALRRREVAKSATTEATLVPNCTPMVISLAPWSPLHVVEGTKIHRDRKRGRRMLWMVACITRTTKTAVAQEEGRGRGMMLLELVLYGRHE